LIYLTLLFSIHCQAQSPEEIERSKKFNQVAEKVVSSFRANPKIEEIDQPDIIQFIDREHKVSYLVTKPGQSAHPAIVMRQILEKDGQLVIKMTAQGGGNKEALKAWLDYMSLQDKIAEVKEGE
jgi:hypothetical protein